MINDLQYQNAHWFLTSKIMPSWNSLAGLGCNSQAQRDLISVIPNSIALLPEFDDEIEASAEIDFYWEDKNWLGRLNYKNAELELWSNLCQEQGPKHELCAEWQHTALKISSIKGVEKVDPAHIWFWADCFSRFVSACRNPVGTARGSLTLIVPKGQLDISTPNLNLCEDDES